MNTHLSSCPECGREDLDTNTYQVSCSGCGWSIQDPDPRYTAHVQALGWEHVTYTEPIVELLDSLPSGFAETLTTNRGALAADHPVNDEGFPSMTGAEFRQRREEFGLSAEWLSERLGVALKTVQRWENGQRRIPHGVAEELDQLSTAVPVRMASEWAEHLLNTPEPVMMIPRTGSHLGFPAPWYRTLASATKDILATEHGDEGLKVAARLRVVYFDEIEEST